jgi:histidinol-phosphatase
LEVGRCSSIPPLSVLDGWRRHLVETLATASAYEPPEQHSALMVAEGLVEVSVQTSGGPWDFAALAVIVEEAGGAFSDLAGAWDIHGGGPVVHSNGAVHAQALARIRAA